MNIFQINILPVIDGDPSFTITTNNPRAYNPVTQRYSSLYSFISMKLNYRITESSTPGYIVLDFDFNSADLAAKDQLIQSGQTLNVYAIADGATTLKQIFQGFITSIRYSRTIKGTFAILTVDTLLGQLTLLNSLTDWNDSTKQYNTIMTNINGSQVELNPFLRQIAEGSLITGIPRGSGDDLTNLIDWFTFIDGNAPALPNKLWAVCQTNKNRDAVLREILFPYNRILWQREDGTIIIQPLFYDDNAEAKWNLDLQANSNNTWLGWDISKNAGHMVNRLDFQFAAILPLDSYGGAYQGGNNIYTSAFANPKYYSRMVALQESGLFNTAILANKSLDSGIITDASLYNSLVQSLNTSQLAQLSQRSPVYYNPVPNDGSATVPQIYASNEMAINLMQAYTMQVIYDYNVMTDETDTSPATQFLDLPLAKIVQVEAYGELDYNAMLCFSCQLSIDQEGSNLIANFVPIESITGSWYYLQGQ